MNNAVEDKHCSKCTNGSDCFLCKDFSNFKQREEVITMYRKSYAVEVEEITIEELNAIASSTEPHGCPSQVGLRDIDRCDDVSCRRCWLLAVEPLRGKWYKITYDNGHFEYVSKAKLHSLYETRM